MQSDNTDNMMFPVAETLADLTIGVTLEPGDLVVTGTPSGVGPCAQAAGLDARRRRLRDRDRRRRPVAQSDRGRALTCRALPPTLWRHFIADIFVAAGCSKEESGRIGKYLVGSNLAGHDSHGVARAPRYVKWKQDGVFFADKTVKRVVDTPVLAILDGQYGFGQTTAPQAVALGIEKCKAMGLSAIGLKNSGHVGRVGEWAEMAAREGLVSIHFVNVRGSVLVAPFGGVDRTFSTAPFCVGIPRKGEKPIILDFATSLVAEGKVLVASQGGKKIPDDALVSQDGSMSGDPHVLYGDYTPEGPREYRKGTGAIRAFGEHKGSGLALMCELLGGALTGNGASQLSRAMVAGHVLLLHRRRQGRSRAFLPGRSHAHDRFREGLEAARSGRRRAGAGRAGRPLSRRAAARTAFRCPTTPGRRCWRSRARSASTAGACRKSSFFEFPILRTEVCHVESDHDLRQPSQRLVQPEAGECACPRSRPPA